MKIQFDADNVQVSGPRKTDGSYTIRFELGEYQNVQAAKIMALPRDMVLKVTVEIDD